MEMQSFESCDSHEVERLEAVLRVELPKKYRRWLLETNGGIVKGQPYFAIRDNPRSDSEILQEFLGISLLHPELDIRSTTHNHLWILRHDHIPIGWCEGSGLLSIKLTSWSDQIYFFDICDEGKQNGLRTPYFVAESIHDLIVSLKYD